MSSDPDPNASKPAGAPGDRLLDAESLKAFAHPLRMQLFDLLNQFGPNTASGLAERLGESSGATSYHLRQLAKHDFVREVEGRGTARERWWERTPGGINLDARRLSTSHAAKAVAQTVARHWQRTSEQALATFMEAYEELPEVWTDAAGIRTANVALTAEQLRELVEHVSQSIDEFVTLHRGQQVPEMRRVQVQFNAFPLIDGEGS